ncbi:hypothetical protein GE09DRAFT_71375 [Coniochaeta sp. 2T2.1]|nr:hypothetical protein GE09DRAFT_71375 [Coniochaeta sp. 2T2.1]
MSPAKTPPTTSPRPPSASPAQDGSTKIPSQADSSTPPSSPALSSASTADGEVSSPEVPPLRAPRLPDHVRSLIRTPSPEPPTGNRGRALTLAFGSPYPPNLRRESLSSEDEDEDEQLDDSPIHRLELQTPFLRPISSDGQELGPDHQQQPSLVSAAAVLANRARRPARGITEDWIRHHTAGDDEDTERRHWLSDGTGSENSSLSGSFSGDEAAWLQKGQDIRTPKANPTKRRGSRKASGKYPRTRSSTETLKQPRLEFQTMDTVANMAPADEVAATEGASEPSVQAPVEQKRPQTPTVPETPKRDGTDDVKDTVEAPKGESTLPVTPSRTVTEKATTSTPRLKKKVPWKGKSIMVLLPRDDQRGPTGDQPTPLHQSAVDNMLKSWEQLGYNTRGFDLDGHDGVSSSSPEHSQSKGAWPDFDDMIRERTERSYKVVLPDLNAWKKYVEELQEAKLRALGVSFGDEDPPPPSVSPGSTMSRQPSITHYPSSLPFSPPIPTSSASSNHAQNGFPFPGPFSGVHSPGIQSVATPTGFAQGKYNPRASISISSPHNMAWSPQQMLAQQQGHRRGSPSLANFGTTASPGSPFSPDGMPNMHQRNQSVQYPFMPPQFQHSARASPRLQELREVEEEAPSKSPSKTPEPTKLARHNSSDSLQKEIDEAEYHLEEQMRSQLDNDRDYSPHYDQKEDEEPVISPGHEREPSVQFGPQAPRFVNDAEGTALHHPRPHSRGHSLSQKYFTEDDMTHDGGFKPSGLTIPENRPSEESEIETNPSNLGTPVQDFEFGKVHQRSFSTASNPWTDNEVSKAGSVSGSQRRTSHGSKPSISKLNVAAPEFKFNPANTFKPSGFSFTAGASAFQPMAFNVGVAAPPSATSSQFSFPAAISSSKINANAPAFSPGQSEFSFSASGPKFRPDAPAFTPLHSLSASINSPLSGAESSSNRPGSIFGSIDLSNSDIIKPAKKSKAVPIRRPDSQGSRSPLRSPRPERPEHQEDDDGRIDLSETRFKRFRGSSKEADSVPLFAPQPTEEESTPVPEPRPAVGNEEEIQLEKAEGEDDHERSFDENLMQADTTFSSTMVSETTDTKATVSPSETSPDQATMNWTPFEFKNNLDLQNFNDARPFGEDNFRKGHKKSLSATAKPFVPGATVFGPPADPSDDDSEDDSFHDSVDNTVELPQLPVVEEPVAAEETLDEDVKQPATEPMVERIDGFVEEPVLVPEEKEEAVEPHVSRSPSPEAPPKRTGLAASRFASPPKGLKASRFAAPSSPPPPAESVDIAPSSPVVSEPADEFIATSPLMSPVEAEDDTLQSLPLGISNNDAVPLDGPDQFAPEEASMEDIDAIMRHLNENPNMGVNKAAEVPQWHQPSPTRHISLAAVTNSSPLHLPPQNAFRSDAPSPSPRQYRALPGEVAPAVLSTEMEDPFLDPPQLTPTYDEDAGIHRLTGTGASPVSDWDGAFTEDEQTKLEARVNFFDGRVNQLVGNLLATRLDPLEETLSDIRKALGVISHRSPSTRRERRSLSAEVQESDADDEDDEVPARRSLSPKRDRKMEQIRAVVLEALATQQRSAPQQDVPVVASDAAVEAKDLNATVVHALEELKEQFSQSLHLDFRGEDLRNIVEEAVDSRMPPSPAPDLLDAANEKNKELQARIDELELKVRQGGDRVEKELDARRAAEERSADLSRRLESAETRIEIEIMNKSAFDQRLSDLEDKLHQQEVKTEEQLEGRRAAEDRLSEVQRLLRISAEEENRLRELVEEKDQRVKSLEASHNKNAMRLTLLEAAQANAQQTQSELQNKLNVGEADIRIARQEARHWQGEAERLIESSTRHEDDLAHAVGENRAMRKLLDTLGTQLQENERMRDNWRSKFLALQNDMAEAAREIGEENARWIKKEQALLARHEVLDARLQAEAKTRERIETELERLEMNERQGMRAISDAKRMEKVIEELQSEKHKLQQTALRFQAEFEEARESGAREVQRTRESMQGQVEEANNEVNVVREELEDQLANVRSQLDRFKLDADTQQARYEMLLEEAQNATKTQVDDLARQHRDELEELFVKHQNEVEDLQARYERQINNTTEDAQRAEQNLLERLSISTSKSEYLQDKVAHLEEKLEIAKEAARAAAQAAKETRTSVTSPEPTTAAVRPAAKSISHTMALPEKISPQALRESIMVLQEQLQQREHRLEELESQLAKVDPEADTKIAKRDDEIIWLRELLAVRHSDLQDIILALGAEDYDVDAVKDAAIRLQANLQMEEQERERAMNGGSAINLPNIAATIRDAATPRVAQAVGPLAAAWGNWRKNREPGSFGSLSGVLSSPAPPASAGRHSATPSKSRPSPASQSLFGGLMTPPASGLRNTPPSNVAGASTSQPTAFASTGRRFPSQSSAASSSRPRGPSASTARQDEKRPLGGTPPRRNLSSSLVSAPVTPPMMRSSAYDSDAQQADEFDSAGFFDDD